jgi:sRNA-binding protein
MGLGLGEGELRLVLTNALHQIAAAINAGVDIEVVANNAERIDAFTQAIGSLQQERHAKAGASAEAASARAMEEKRDAEQRGAKLS